MLRQRYKKYKDTSITLGVDPEFAIETDKGRLIPAYDVYSPDDPRREPFGLDSNESTGEVRTGYSRDPKEIIKQLKTILEKAKTLYPNAYRYNLKACSSNLSVGGHIHFGHPLLRRGSLNRQNLINQTTDNLDSLLAFPCFYLDSLPSRKFRLRNGEYGFLSDTRNQPWGFEYRTLPSFLASRQLSSCVLYVAHSIADATLFYNFKTKGLIYDPIFRDAFNFKLDKNLLKPHLKVAFSELVKLPKYKVKEYQGWTDKFINLVKKGKCLVDVEIKKGWNISFDIDEYWNKEKIETITDKITAFLVRVHSQPPDYKLETTSFVQGSSNDFACPTIARNVGSAFIAFLNSDLLESLDESQQRVWVFGLSRKRANEIWLNVSHLSAKKKKQLLGIAWDLASKIPHKTKITNIKIVKDKTVKDKLPHLGFHGVGFGRKIRKENTLLAEAITLLVLLMSNPESYKKTENKKKLYLTKGKFVKPLLKNFANAPTYKVKIPMQTHKGLKIPKILNLNNPAGHLGSDLNTVPYYYQQEICIASTGLIKKLMKLQYTKCTCKETQPSTPLKKYCLSCLAHRMIRAYKNHFPAIEITRCNKCSNYLFYKGFCRKCGYCKKCCICSKTKEKKKEEKDHPYSWATSILEDLESPL